MLHELSITSLGVISSARLPLRPGLTVVTGETGAGKTMVLTGLGLILGGKATPDAVRVGAEEAVAEAIYDVPETSEGRALAVDAGAVFDEDGTVTVVRTVGSTTRSRSILGGRTVPQALLAQVGEELVTVHGQADQVRLRTPARQRQLLDAYAGPLHGEALAQYRTAWAAWREEADALIAAPRGRAAQMNAGAAAARGEVLLFLHADTLLPRESGRAVLGALQDPAVIGGAFRVRLAASPGAGRYVRASLGITGRMIGARAAVSRSYSGDQAIFVRTEAFRSVGGYPEIPLMEDVELARRMRREGKTVLLPLRVETSGRRWETWGPLRTVLFMWRLRIGYLLGRTPSRCAEAYGRGPA